LPSCEGGAARTWLQSRLTLGCKQLLQRSGIGAGAVLQAAGIEVLHDLPCVGENLQDRSEDLHPVRRPPP
jgi:choline dehydrogenase